MFFHSDVLRLHWRIKENGDRYEIIFQEDKEFEGDGYIYYKNGDIYNGHIENEMKNGKGILIKKNGNKFEGIFKENKEYTGNGYICYENGDIYNGHLENGIKEGEGILIKTNGEKFEGTFKEDKEYTGINYIKKLALRSGRCLSKRLRVRGHGLQAGCSL